MLTISYSDFRRLLKIENPHELVPGLELRADGVYVTPVSELEDRLTPADSPDMQERTRHPTGNLEEPVLSLPCNVAELERFVDGYIPNSIDPFELVAMLTQRAFELARIEATEQGTYHWPIVAGIYGLQSRLEQQLNGETNDSKKVVLRETLDEIENVLAGSGAPEKPDADVDKPMDSRERTTLLRMIRALEVIAKLPERNAASMIEKRSSSLGFTGPGADTIRGKLTEARALPRDKKTV